MAERVSAIIPAYNEADIIRDTVSAALTIPGLTHLIVVDDASSDATAAVAESAGAHVVIRLETNEGKGGALNRGFECADGEIILMLDADLGASASQGWRLLQPVLDGEADMTIGRFDRSAAEAAGNLAPRSRGFGNVVRIARAGIKFITGEHITAPLSGQRAFKREIIERSGGFGSGFGVEVGLTIDALRMGYRILEVPVDMAHRASGRDIRGFLHRGRQMLDVLRMLFLKARHR